MSPLIYWIIFTILVGLIIVFVSYIIFNFIVDKCLGDPEESGKMHRIGSTDSSEGCRLSKYQFDKTDVEDLTRIEGDFKTISPNISYTNEVESGSIDKLLKRTPSHSLSDINDENSSRYSMEDLHSAASVYSTITEEREEEDQKDSKGISKSVDDLEFCNPEAIDTLKEIHRIKEEATKVEKDMKYFVGGTNDVMFYEINEKFLKLMIALCDVVCETDALRRKKSETLEYIEGCQKKLKEKIK